MDFKNRDTCIFSNAYVTMKNSIEDTVDFNGKESITLNTFQNFNDDVPNIDMEFTTEE